MSTAYKGDFAWNITDSSEVSAFLNASAGTRFTSRIFQIGGLQWQLSAYPAGKYAPNKSNKHYISGCELFLSLMSSSWPKNVYKLVFNYRLSCKQANSSFTNIAQFTANQQPNDYTVSWYRGTLTTSELEALEGQHINLQCHVNILALIATDKYSIMYQFPYRLNKNQRVVQFQWKVANTNELFVNTQCGKHIESEIFNDFWCLRVAPKGWKLTEQKYVHLWLQLCCLPMNVSKMECKYTIKCVEANVLYEGHSSFDYNAFHKNAGWNQRRLVTASLAKFNALTFQCRVHILKQYDLNGRLIPVENVNVEEESKLNDSWNMLEDAEQKKEESASEIAELKKEIASLNIKVAEMQATITALQAQISGTEEKREMDDHWMSNVVIVEMINEMKSEIAMLKQESIVSDSQNVPGAKVKQMNEVESWLKNIVRLPEYYSLFRKQGVDDLKTVQMLTMQQLQAMGIEKTGHRLKIMSAIQSLIQTNANNNNDNNPPSLYYPTPNDAK